MNKLEYRGTHKCPVAALAAFTVGKAFGDIMDDLERQGVIGDREFEVYARHMDAFLQAAYDRGYDDGMKHQSGLSVESFRERADALKRRAQENGHVHGWEDDGGAVPLHNINRSFEDGVLDEVRTIEHKEAA